MPLGGLLSLSPAYPAFSFISCPHPPNPLPLRGRGRSKVYFAGGFAPGTPALDRSRHLQTFPNRSPAQRGVRGLPPEWQEMLFFGQCRQPRRGGTGGDGAIRRTRRRRLRWSSPPGRGEQVPPGAPPLASPRRSRRRHGLNLRRRCPRRGQNPGGTCRVRRIRQLFQKRARAVAPSIKIREKFWGVWGTLSRVPQRFSLPPSPQPCFYLLIDNKEKKS